MAMTVGAIDAIRTHLSTIPQKNDTARELTRQEAIARMSSEVLALRERGYSWKDVADFISRKGCRISAAALKTRLSRNGLTSKAIEPNAGNVARPAETASPAEPADGGERNATSPSKHGESAGAQGAVSRGAPTVPKLAPGTFALREDSKDL
jgi:hypothetical protein